MWPRGITFAVCLILPAIAALAGDGGSMLRPGAYAVSYRLEVPHAERWAIDQEATICVTAPQGSDQSRLPVLSGNNPLSQCPAANIRRNGASLSFDIRCESRDGARAHAVYHLAPEGFDGQIDMVMGGKNMTFVEVQTGRRVGSCTVASAPSMR
jgi:hypothetical protein